MPRPGDTFDLDHPPADGTLGGEAGARAGAHPSLPHLTIGTLGPDVSPGGPDLALLGPIGEGGMGVVWLARQASLGREVAIKRLKPDAPSRADEALLREARFMGGLEHPNIVPVHALGLEDDERPALVMKRIEGVDWGTLVREPDHPHWQDEPRAERLVRHVEILVEVCRAVQFAHDRGVVHRDLKPGNVRIGAYGEVYVMDWGVAARLPDDAVTTTVVGTPAYMAPELATPGAPIGPATDVFPLGACLVEVLTGEPPWDAQGVAQALAQARACPPLELPGAPAELALVARRACAKDPAARHPDAAALQKALQGWVRQRHALHLVAAARARLDALRAALVDPSDGARARIEAAFSECRFGFAQALEASPGLEAARAGLRDATGAMVRYAIVHGELDLARAHLDALAELGGEVAALREAHEAAVRTREGERALAREMDADVALRERMWWTAALAVFTFVVTGAILSLPLVSVTYGHAAATTVMVGLTLLLPPGILATRRWALANRVTRTLVALVVTADLAVLLHRLLSWAYDVPVEAMLAGDLLLMAVAGVGSTVVDRRSLPMVPVLVAGALAVACWPEAALPLFGVAVVGTVVVAGLALVWGR